MTDKNRFGQDKAACDCRRHPAVLPIFVPILMVVCHLKELNTVPRLPNSVLSVLVQRTGAVNFSLLWNAFGSFLSRAAFTWACNMRIAALTISGFGGANVSSTPLCD